MWWMPSWLEKRLPHLNIEPPEETHHAGAPIGPPQPQPTG
jgi:RND superfamily putative drug exporter